MVETKPTSLAPKSMVRAFSSPGKTVMRPLPLIQYCHSLPFGCQCISRIQPGLTVTIADAIFADAGKFFESMIFTLPASFSLVGFMELALKVKDILGLFARRATSAISSLSDLVGSSLGKM